MVGHGGPNAISLRHSRGRLGSVTPAHEGWCGCRDGPGRRRRRRPRTGFPFASTAREDTTRRSVGDRHGGVAGSGQVRGVGHEQVQREGGFVDAREGRVRRAWVADLSGGAEPAEGERCLPARRASVQADPRALRDRVGPAGLRRGARAADVPLARRGCANDDLDVAVGQPRPASDAGIRGGAGTSSRPGSWSCRRSSTRKARRRTKLAGRCSASRRRRITSGSATLAAGAVI